MGATKAINVQSEDLSKTLKTLHLKGFTVGMEMSGSEEALNTLLKPTRNGATIALLGILSPKTTIDFNLVIFKMLTLKGIYGRDIFKTWYQLSHLLESGLDISKVITHTFTFHEFEKAFSVMFSKESGKVLVEGDL